MLEVLLAILTTGVSLLASMSILRLRAAIPMEARGMAGLGATVVHLLLCLGLPAICFIALKPSQPLIFALSVLFFYWISLIILVVAIIRWLREGSPRS